MSKKIMAWAAATGLALAGFAHAVAASGGATLGSPTASQNQDSRLSPVAKSALDRFLAFIETVQSTTTITKESLGKGMDVVLVKREGGDAYTSPAFVGGWSYGVQRLDPSEQMKTGVKFGFFNADEAADPAPICAASLEKVPSSLVSHGFVEDITPGEIGEVVAWNFGKNDLVLSVTPYDLVGGSVEAQCVRVIRSNDGRQSSAKKVATKKDGGPITSETTGHRATNTAKDALDRFFTYVSRLRSTSELTKAHVEQGLDIAFGNDEEGDFYRSPGLGGGWTYVVRRHDPRGPWKAGLTFGFFNTDPSADPTPVCVATLGQVRLSFASRGFSEAITPGEIGQVVAWNFVKSDLVFTVTPHDLATTPDGASCVLVIHTTDG